MTQALSAVLLTPSAQNTSESMPSLTIQDLPRELMLKIFSELSAPDASKMSRVCRVWQQLLNDEALWKFFSNRDFKLCMDPSPIHSSQESYQSRYILYASYVHGLYAQRTLMQHEDRVTSLVHADGLLLSASLDRSINIWNIEAGNCSTITEAYSELFAMPHEQLDMFTSLVDGDGVLYSGSLDKTIKVWDKKTQACINTLRGHTSKVKSVAYANRLLFSGSLDTTIKIWDTETSECITTLNGHTNLVKFLIYADGQLISGSRDNTIKIWNPETHACLHTLNEHTYKITALIYIEELLFSGSLDTTIKIWETNTGTCLRTLSGHKDRISCLVFVEEVLFSGSYDNTIKMWNILTRRLPKYI